MLSIARRCRPISSPSYRLQQLCPAASTWLLDIRNIGMSWVVVNVAYTLQKIELEHPGTFRKLRFVGCLYRRKINSEKTRVQGVVTKIKRIAVHIILVRRVRRLAEVALSHHPMSKARKARGIAHG